MKNVKHTFGPGETVRSAIRKYNRYDMPDAIVEELIKEYKKINKEGVPRVGDAVKIPLYGFIGQEEPVKQNRTVKKVPIRKAPPSNLIAPPPIQPIVKKSKKGEIVNFPKSIKELDPKKVKIEDEETDAKVMMNRVERRRKARLEKEKLVLEQEKEIKETPEEHIEVPTLKEIQDKIIEDIKKTEDPILQKPKKKDPVEKKKKVKEPVEVKKEPTKKVDRKKELKQRRENRRKKDVDKAKMLNRINRNRRRR